MNKAWLIAKHEYLHNIRRGGFLFAAFGVPLITIVMMVIVFSLTIDNETDTTRVGAVGYVDLAGVLSAGIEQPEGFQAYESEGAARSALDAGELGAYFVVDPNYMGNGMIRLISVGADREHTITLGNPFV